MIGRFKMRTAPPPGRKYVRDWTGLKVKTKVQMRNGWFEVPAGSIATVEASLGGTGLTLRTDACACCGVKVLISRVSSSDVEVIE